MKDSLIKDATREECITAIRKDKLEHGDDKGYYVQIQNPGSRETTIIEGSKPSTKVNSGAWGRIWYKGKFLKEFKGPLNVVRQDMIKYLQQSTQDTIPLKTYKIKNHDSGKTYSVKATSYQDAKDKYNKHIKDALSQSDKEIIDDAIKDVKKEGKPISSKNVISYLDKNMSGFVGKNKDDIIKYVDNLTKDSFQEDEIAGWIAIYNGTKIEIKKDEANSLYAAKKIAIEKFKQKFRNVKEHMISIEPGYNDSFQEDAVEYSTLLANLGFMHYQGSGEIQKWKYREHDYRQFEKAINHIKRITNKLILSSSSESSGEFLITIQKPENNYIGDANLAQLEIKSLFHESLEDADEIKYLGFNDDRKISFYQYQEDYYAFFDLENRVEKITKDEVQRILKKNLITETEKEDDELFGEGNPGLAATVRGEDSQVSYVETYNNSKIYQDLETKNYIANVYTKSLMDKSLSMLKRRIDIEVEAYKNRYRNLDSVHDSSKEYIQRQIDDITDKLKEIQAGRMTGNETELRKKRDELRKRLVNMKDMFDVNGEISLSEFDPKRLVENSKKRQTALHNEIRMKNGDLYMVFFRAIGLVEEPKNIEVSIVWESADRKQQKRVAAENFKTYDEAIKYMEKWKNSVKGGDK